MSAEFSSVNSPNIAASLSEIFSQLRIVTRNTGRTTNMLNQVENGDIVVTWDSNHAGWIQNELLKMGIRAQVVSGQHKDKMDFHGHRGRIHYDHNYQEKVIEAFLLEKAKQFNV